MSQAFELGATPWTFRWVIPMTARQIGRATRHQLELLVKAPATVTLVTLMWALAIATDSLMHGPSPHLLSHVGASVASLEHLRLTTLITQAFWAPNFAAYIFASLSLLLIGGAIEREWGHHRFAAAAFVSQIVGVALALIIVAIADRLDGTWSPQLAGTAAVGPGALLAGVILAFTASMGALWRRRVRLGVLATLLTLVLFGGLLEDVIRLGGAVTGLALGLVLVKRPPQRLTLRSTRRETRVLVAIVLAASAAGSVLAALSTTEVGPLAVLQYWFTSSAPDPATLHRICSDPASADMCGDLRLQLRFGGVGPSILALMPAVLVIALAEGLRRGRQFAWWCAVILHSLMAAAAAWLAFTALETRSHEAGLFTFINRSSVVGVAVPLLQPVLVVMLLLVTRRAFNVTAPRGTYARFGAMLGVAAAGLYLLFVLGGLALRDQFIPHPSAARFLTEFPLRLVPPGYLGLAEMNFAPNSPAATMLFEWIGVIFWAVVLAGTLNTFSKADAQILDDDATKSRAILRRNGSVPLNYMTSWRGNSYWFTDSGRSYVAYRLKGLVCITTGAPVGPEEERAAAIRGFAEFCEQRCWVPCFYGVTDEVRLLTRELGWPDVLIAQDTLLRLGEVAFSGKKFQDVRTAINRAARAGIRAVPASYSSESRGITDQIDSISEEWASNKGLPEMEFTLGTLDEVDDPAVRCLLAIDESGTVHGVTSWLPAYRDDAVIGWTLDFLRRRADGFNGVMDFLIASAALQFQREGAEFMSLSATPFVESTRGSRTTERILETVSRALEPRYGFRSLFAFKSKFQPQLNPLYLAYPETAALPRVAKAVYRAYLPRVGVRDSARMAAAMFMTQMRAHISESRSPIARPVRVSTRNGT